MYSAWRLLEPAEAPALRADGRVRGSPVRQVSLPYACQVVLPATPALLLVSAESLGDADAVWTMLLLDSVKGRLLHYSVAINPLRILVTELSRLVGPVSEELYDCAIPMPPCLSDLSSEICGVIQISASRGAWYATYQSSG